MLILGIICLKWPHKLQQMHLDSYDRQPTLAKLDPFMGIAREPELYLPVYIVQGIVLIAVAFCLLYIGITGHDPFPHDPLPKAQLQSIHETRSN